MFKLSWFLLGSMCFYVLIKFIKQICSIIWTGTSFWMVLNRENRLADNLQAFDRSIKK